MTPSQVMEMMGMADTTPPVASISGLKGTVTLKALLKGLRPRVLADERSAYEVELLGAPRSAQLARTYNLTLARRALPLDIGVRTAALKPNRKLIGRARRFTVRVAVTPTDGAGNRGKTVVKTVKVRR
jgi:hypothetical protein